MQNHFNNELTRLLSIEFNCAPEDFSRSEDILTVSALNEGRRIYSPEKPIFKMATLGRNTVISADEYLHGFLHEFISDVHGHRLFELPALMKINEELRRYGHTLSPTYHMFMPKKLAPAVGNYDVKWFFCRDIDQFYGDERFPNAICSEFDHNRPDRIVVCAFDGNEIMGMAGCSEDAPHWQQIGIDVMPEYRSKGLGTFLVSLLAQRIAESGDIPFYGAAIANYHSWNIAINCGFRPAWVEINSKKMH